jgi:CRP-like cAMP-binding protein
MVQAEAADRFLSAALMGDVDPASRRAVLEALVEERAPAGSVLLAQGQPNDHLSFLIGGAATIERARPDGPNEVLATLHAPSVFGTTSFFDSGAPTFNVRAATEVWLLTLYHPAHDRLRRDNPRAAEALAVAAVRVLSERFNELDRMFSDYMRRHPDAKSTEWAGFRARLFEEPAD